MYKPMHPSAEPGVPPGKAPKQSTMTRAERRELQEQQKAAKAAARTQACRLTPLPSRTCPDRPNV